MIPRRVGNLTPVLCGVTDDLLKHIETSSDGRIEDLTEMITKWAFQSKRNPFCIYCLSM